MTKEELEKEAEEWLCNNLHSASEEDFIKAMVDIAEPREKQIQALGERCLQLQKDKGNLIDRCRELEAQIEKMKCCLFCAYRSIDWNFSSICIQKDNAKIENPYTCKCDKWEIKENAELKHTIATLRQEKDNVSMHAKAMEVVAKTKSDQLTKSKELLKKWLQTSKASGCNNINIITDTEQFLKESE